MKPTQFPLTFAASLASLLVISGSFSYVLANTKIEVNSSHPTALIAQNKPVIASGTFTKAEAPTTGTAKIIMENGKPFLEIDAAFSTTDQAPDLHVLLDTAAVPGKSYSDFNRYINLGKLQKNKGSQRYPIPSAVNLGQYKSVVIWCRMANATIGYASLKK